MKTTSSLAAALAMAVFMSVGIAMAADFTWTNTATAQQDWNSAGNWSPNGVPSSDSDTAILGDIDTSTSPRTLRLVADATVSGVHAEAKTNIWTISDVWTGKMLVFKAASGNAVIDVKNFGGTDPGGYYGNLRFDSAGVPLRFESDTDITITNDSTSKSYLNFALPLAGSSTINVYGNGSLQLPGGDSPYTGTINLYNACNAANPNILPRSAIALTNAAGIVVHTGTILNLGGQYSAGVDYNALIVLNGGRLDNGAGWHYLKNVRVTKDSNVDPGYWNTIFNGTISGTGTVNQSGNGSLSIIGCDIKPGFSTGILNFNRANGDFYFASNSLPVTLHVEVNSGGVPGANYDQVNVTGVQAGRDVDLANVKVVFSGAGGGAETIWFFTANLIVNGSTLASVSNAPGISSTIVYDYPGNRVGAIVVPEPAALLALACGALLLGRRRRV